MSPSRNTLLCAIVALLGAGPLAGCSPDFDHIDFEERTTAPVPVSIGYDQISLEVGVAVAVIAKPIAGGDEMDEDTEVSLRSNDTGVLGLDEALEDRSFVLYGVGPGTTSVLVDIDGETRGRIPVSVTLQR